MAAAPNKPLGHSKPAEAAKTEQGKTEAKEVKPAAGPKMPKNFIPLPRTRQSTNWTCGVAALQSVLMYFGDEYREDRLVPVLKSNKDIGTPCEVSWPDSVGQHCRQHLARTCQISALHRPLSSSHNRWGMRPSATSITRWTR
jgi:hypothetical protein